MPHLDEGTLHAWLDGALAAAEAERLGVAAHLETCPDCRARLEEARRLRARAGTILEAAAPTAVARPPFETIRARAGTDAGAGARAGDPERAPEEGARGDARRRRTAADPRRLAWAAGLVLALGAGWMARQLAYGPGGPGAEPPPPAVATTGERAETDALDGRGAGDRPRSPEEGAEREARAPEEEAVRDGASGARELAAAGEPRREAERFEAGARPEAVVDEDISRRVAEGAAAAAPPEGEVRIEGQDADVMLENAAPIKANARDEAAPPPEADRGAAPGEPKARARPADEPSPQAAAGDAALRKAEEPGAPRDASGCWRLEYGWPFGAELPVRLELRPEMDPGGGGEAILSGGGPEPAALRWALAGPDSIRVDGGAGWRWRFRLGIEGGGLAGSARVWTPEGADAGGPVAARRVDCDEVSGR